MLAEPVGTGKTWIGLAAARTEGGAATAVVPSTLAEQWRRAARAAGVELTLTTHEQWSRGPRTLGPGLVLIDESHRFRNPATRRVAHLAPALVGRRGLLITATPVVNRFDDLSAQLRLVVRDDVLRGTGEPSLRRALANGAPPTTLSELVITTVVGAAGRPPVARHLVPGAENGSPSGWPRLLEGLDRLVLSRSAPVRALLQSVLTVALASSPAAFREALLRYRHLLLHGTEAVGKGHRATRQSLRQALSGDLEQLVMWEVLPPHSGPEDLVFEDIPELDLLLRAAGAAESGPDPKADQLQAILDDQRPTIVFVCSRATVHHLRRRLRPTARIAWLTGAEAGIGGPRAHRSAVLSWFLPDAPTTAGLGPRVLITTDVAAEGLDLHRAERVVHYDLPWTAVRLEQRTGRAARVGSRHREVAEVRFDPPPSIERRLRLLDVLTAKSRMPERVGLGDRGAAWRWRAEIAADLDRPDALPGVACVPGGFEGLLVGAEICSGGRVLAVPAWYRDAHGFWTDEPSTLEAALRRAEGRSEVHPLPADRLERGLRWAAEQLKRAVRAAAGSLGLPERPSTEAARVIHRLHQRATAAFRHRDRPEMARIDRGFAFLRRGHTLGEEHLIGRLARATDPELGQLLDLVPEGDLPTVLRARLTGLIFFGSTASSAGLGTHLAPRS
jgi:hypothetical protein